MKIEVHLQGGLRKVIDIDPRATWGATVGVNVWNQDGTLWVPPAGGGGQMQVTDWTLITSIPPNVKALAETTTSGLYALTGPGTSATRTITAGAPLSVTNGDGVGGNPAISLPTGDLVAGSNISLTGSGVGRLAGAGNVTVNVTGVFTLIGEVIVSSAQQDIDFTGLDLDAAGTYHLHLYSVPDTAVSQLVSLFYNGDVTPANYNRQLLIATGPTVFADMAFDAFVVTTNAITSTSYVSSCSMTINKVVGGPAATVISQQSYDVDTVMSVTGAHLWWVTGANVTEIKLRHSTNFGAGTRARLYALS